jgi:ribosomal protein S8E
MDCAPSTSRYLLYCNVNAFMVACITVATRKTRILDVVHNATNNEMVRTKTLVKGAIVSIDATPFRQWYEAHYGVTIGHKKGKKVCVYI